MAIISYVDNASQMAEAFLEKKYSKLDTIIKNNENNITYCVSNGTMTAGYNITANESLSSIYKMNVYVVKFVLSNVDTHHSKEQYKFLQTMFENLKREMEHMGGYFNIRVPSHIVDIIKLINKTFTTNNFCGGTVQQLISGKRIERLIGEGITVEFKDKEYISKNKDLLLDMAYHSFSNYQGQYHISEVMEAKAGLIYRNWLKSSIENSHNNVIVAEYNSIPSGFFTIDETDTSVEVLLTATDEKYRGRGLYRSMLEHVINYAEQKHKHFIISTQFDNFIVQGVWSSLGLVPFYSIYNFHIVL